MGSPAMLCVILKIILCLWVKCAHGENLYGEDRDPYITVTDLPPVNLTRDDFTVSNCNATTPSHQLRTSHIYLVIMFIIFFIFCCIMLAK